MNTSEKTQVNEHKWMNTSEKTQVNKHKWKRNVKKNFTAFQDKCLHFKVNDYEITLYSYDENT